MHQEKIQSMISDQEFHALVKLAEIPEQERVADKSKLATMYEKQLRSPTARNVGALLRGNSHSSNLALAWRDAVLRAAGEPS